jgi:hypothetical protein
MCVPARTRVSFDVVLSSYNIILVLDLSPYDIILVLDLSPYDIIRSDVESESWSVCACYVYGDLCMYVCMI